MDSRKLEVLKQADISDFQVFARLHDDEPTPGNGTGGPVEGPQMENDSVYPFNQANQMVPIAATVNLEDRLRRVEDALLEVLEATLRIEDRITKLERVKAALIAANAELQQTLRQVVLHEPR
jgi:hypothetical protein